MCIRDRDVTDWWTIKKIISKRTNQTKSYSICQFPPKRGRKCSKHQNSNIDFSTLHRIDIDFGDWKNGKNTQIKTQRLITMLVQICLDKTSYVFHCITHRDETIHPCQICVAQALSTYPSFLSCEPSPSPQHIFSQ
eukprot:TRINITY_DN9634_c0_g1_i1.p1 TRINITY_DN9634_c0_g1~~TRINITY_DN9634_c0_g1_i1.p1  ORF type:complete len:156 (+),score=3.50 TRINITY_DN9634_c0_g1_i1:61-468(+)